MSKQMGEVWARDDGSTILVGVPDSARRRIYLDKKGRVQWRDKIITGLKRLAVTLPDGSELKTPHGNKVMRRRIAANKVAKQSRKRNRRNR